jgi:hypothetical protein
MADRYHEVPRSLPVLSEQYFEAETIFLFFVLFPPPLFALEYSLRCLSAKGSNERLLLNCAYINTLHRAHPIVSDDKQLHRGLRGLVSVGGDQCFAALCSESRCRLHKDGYLRRFFFWQYIYIFDSIRRLGLKPMLIKDLYGVYSHRQ